MQDFTGVPRRRPRHDARGDGRTSAATRRRSTRSPGRAGHRPLGHRRFLRLAAAPRLNVEPRVRAQPRALPVPALGPDGLRRVQGRPPAPASSTRSTSRPSPASSWSADGAAYPDTCVGTDSTPRWSTASAVLGWGVGGIEAEAAMLGQPVSMLIPRVVGFKLTGSLPEGATATDLVLTITEMLRSTASSGSSSSSTATASGLPPRQPRDHRQHEPGTAPTVAIFPIDDETLRYLTPHRPSGEQVALVEAYTKTQGLWHDPSHEPVSPRSTSSSTSATVVPVARRPEAPAGPRDAPRPSRRGSPRRRRRTPRGRRTATLRSTARRSPSATTAPDDRAPITSCTNTSNPSVMVGAGAAGEEGGREGPHPRKPWVKTTLAPGRGRHRLRQGRPARPTSSKMGFDLVGYGCTTCIGNSGPLPEVSRRSTPRTSPSRSPVLSGQPQLRGPDQPRHQDELPRVAAAGRRLRDRRHDGHRPDDRARSAPTPTATRSSSRHLALAAEVRRRPSTARSTPTCSLAVRRRLRRRRAWQSLPTPTGDTFAWAGRRVRAQAPVLRRHAATRRRSPTSPARVLASSATR